MRTVLTIASIFLAFEVMATEEVRVNVGKGAPEAQNTYAEKYSSNYHLRSERKIGTGFQVGGGSGVAGINLEFNLDTENSVIMGAGTGPGYGTVQMLWRKSFEGHYLSPYVTAGWSRWYNAGNPDDDKNSVILDRVLNEDQKKTSRFNVDFFTASLGMQYQELGGFLEGASFYMEFGLMAVLGKFTPLPTGAVGIIYYY